MKAVKIGGRMVGQGFPTYVVAEIASNFDADLKRAKHLVDLAKDCGCDAVKFQSFLPDKIICKEAFKMKKAFQAKWKKPVYQIYKDAHFLREWHAEVFSYCERKKVTFFSSPYDEEAIELLEELGVVAHKIGSGEISWPKRLERFGRTGKPIILGVGAATLAEIDEAVRTIQSTGNDQLVLLQCVTNYPSPFEDANIMVIETLKRAFDVPIGYSDHTPGSVVPLGAVARGACMIEKHFTDDRKRAGPDHPFSMEPSDMEEMVKNIRNLEKALGTTVKKVAPSESETVILQRRSLFAARDIKKGEAFSKNNVAVLRPQLGIMPRDYDKVIGKKSAKNIKKGDPIEWGNVA